MWPQLEMIFALLEGQLGKKSCENLKKTMGERQCICKEKRRVFPSSWEKRRSKKGFERCSLGLGLLTQNYILQHSHKASFPFINELEICLFVVS